MAQEAHVSVSFTLREDEVRAITRALIRRRHRWWWLPAASAFLIVVGIVAADTAVTLFAAVGLAWWTLCCVVIAPRTVWARCEHGPQEYVFDVEGVTARLPAAESRTTWDYWSHVLRVGDSYVLRTLRGQSFIPRRAFDSPAAEERFRELAGDRWSDGPISV